MILNENKTKKLMDKNQYYQHHALTIFILSGLKVNTTIFNTFQYQKLLSTISE